MITCPDTGVTGWKMTTEEPLHRTIASNRSAISKMTKDNEGKKAGVKMRRDKMRSPEMLYPRETHTLFTVRYTAKEKGTPPKCAHM